ncbi:MAG: alpha/beta hydrolase [Dehalococcoidia bacterium]
MNRIEYLSGIAGLALSAIVFLLLGSWSTPIAILWEAAVIVLVITVVFVSSKPLSVPIVTPLTDQGGSAQAPEPRDTLEAQVQELGFRHIGDFDVTIMAQTSVRIRTYVDADSLCAAILIDITSDNSKKTVLEFCTKLHPSGSITTTTDSNPNIIAYQLDKMRVNVPWKKTAADVFELHQSLCRTALDAKFTPAAIYSTSFAESLTDDTRKDYEYQVKSHRLRRVAEGRYRLTLLEAIIAAPLLWYQMAYGRLFFWYKLPDGFFHRKLRKRLHRFNRKTVRFGVLKLLWLCFIAALQTTWNRLRRGPVSPERNLKLEICVVATRKLLTEMNTWPPARMQAVASLGLPRKFLRRVEILRVSLAGVPAERTIARGADNGPILLYIHGGGMVLCSPRSHRDIISHIAIASGARVYAPDYGLAPQNPFPAGLQDVFIAYRALLDQGIQPNKIVIAGDSAGGTLTLALLLKLREAGLPNPAAAVTICPGPDLTFPGESWTRNSTTDCLTLPVVRQWMSYYARPDQLNDPLVSPIHGKFTGLPPILVQTGTSECLYDNITLLVEKLKAAQVDVTFEIYPEMPHVWHLYRAVTPQGDAAIQSIARYIIAHTSEADRIR